MEMLLSPGKQVLLLKLKLLQQLLLCMLCGGHRCGCRQCYPSRLQGWQLLLLRMLCLLRQCVVA
jgi:hypothetical protein